MFNTVTPPLINISARNLDSGRLKQDTRIGVSRNANNNDRIMMNNNGITTNKTAEVNFCGLAGSKPPSKFAKWFNNSDKVKWALEKINEHNLFFSASFALLLTCVLRPASIMVLPSKKNQDDQKYAAAHSIASGVIGFALSTAIFTPLQNGANKLKKALNDKQSLDKILKNSQSYLKDEKLLKIASTYMDRIPDIVFSAPKGILTVALIPPILKHVFGWEKKKPEAKNIQTQTESSAKGGQK